MRGVKGSGNIVAVHRLLTEKEMCLSALSEEERAIFFAHHLVTVSIVRHARDFTPHFMVWSYASLTRVAVALQPVAIIRYCNLSPAEKDSRMRSLHAAVNLQTRE